MTPNEFKSRYLEVLRESFKEAPVDMREGLEQKFSQFFTFSADLLKKSSLPAPTQNFLRDIGLPATAAPALNFFNLYEVQPDFETHPLFKDYFLLGTAGGRRLLGIDQKRGEINCFEMTEDGVEFLFVNSSLEAFAECLCLFQEHRERNELDVCLQAMRRIDSGLSENYSFWEEETQDFFDNVLEKINEAARKSGT